MENKPYRSRQYPRRHLSFVQDVLDELQQKFKAPDALIAMEMGNIMGAVVQSLYDVLSPTGQRRPTTCYWLMLAESGERKTAVRNAASKPIQDFDKEMRQKYETDLQQYHADVSVWKSNLTGVRQKLAKFVREGKSTVDVELELEAHVKKKPLKPRLRRMMRQLTTKRALVDALEGTGESVCFDSDEGEVLLKGGMFSQVGMLNTFWDGSELVMDRSQDEHLCVSEPRFSISFMVQPSVLKDFLNKRGDVLRGSGHWARYLVGYPESTQGTRFIYDLNAEYMHLPKFHARVRELLALHAERLEKGITEREVLELDEDAKRRWVTLANEIECMLQPHQYMHDINDFASKALEIVLRLAAIMHVFSSLEGKISLDTFERAIDIVGWHLDEYKMLFSDEMAVPEAIMNAEKLEDFLFRKVWQPQYTWIRRNDALNVGPVRTKKKFDPALETLISMGRVWIDVGASRERVIVLNPQYFASKQVNPLLAGSF